MKNPTAANTYKIPAILTLIAIAAILALSAVITVSAQSDDPDWETASDQLERNRWRPGRRTGPYLGRPPAGHQDAVRLPGHLDPRR